MKVMEMEVEGQGVVSEEVIDQVEKAVGGGSADSGGS